MIPLDVCFSLIFHFHQGICAFNLLLRAYYVLGILLEIEEQMQSRAETLNYVLKTTLGTQAY